ncbi:serine/threonine-protein kinase [Akkermansia sp.]|uniref:serine/threonine-protein kinase n=1 Tax=Akkermansia sp. TaxID=1872421 RepID=UPI0025C0EC8A|nr:serine/threonine-protein kinase [Akkermansia sp.]MCC8148214.1 serine/threonine protein kinase [Akkermansia sp.]
MNPQQDQIIDCPECGQPMDVSQLPPYANAICPGCQALTRVKTRMGPYRITGKLGKGGMSVVYRAEDTVLGREVALKVLNDTYAGDALRSERFEREAQIMARVSHENLVQIYAVGRDQGLFYIAMELVEGAGLDSLITAEERVPEDKVLRLTLDIVRGLDAAWNAGLMHRDIKPANILQSPDGVAKIVDFGLSLLQSESDVEREIWVTPYYAAPETLLRGEEDFRTDMYALGATMYHLLVGAPPRVDASQSSDVLLETKKNLPPLEQVVNDISPMTCFIVDKLMAFHKEDRFSSYPELMDAVEQALEEDVRAMQDGLTWAERRAAEMRRTRRRKCRIIVASSVASVVVLGLGIWGWAAWQQGKGGSRGTPPPALPPTAGKGTTVEDMDAAESRLERSIRFGNLFNEAQESLNRGDLVRAAAMFGDLADQPDCPLSTSLWAGLNQVLCMWVRGQFPEGVERLEKLGKKVEGCKDPAELERSRDVGNLVMYLSSGDWSSRMPGLRSNSDLAIHYYVGMALKSWYFAGKWPEYGAFLEQVASGAADDQEKNIRELASAWLSNLKEYTAQYERLKRLQDMPEKTVAEVVAKRSAVDFLREQMMTGEVASMPPAYAALEGMLDHLRMQYQTARDWEAEEAARMAKIREEEERKKAREEEEKREALLAQQSRSYEDVCREADAVMKKTGDYEKVSAAYGAAEQVIASPAVKARLTVRREMTDQMLPLFTRMEKILPGLLEKKPGKPLALKDGTKVRLTGIKDHLLTVEPQDSREGSGAYQVSWDELPFNSLYALARECRQKQPADFVPLSDTYSKPLLIFGSLTETISPTQKENVLLQMDRAFIEKWNLWMGALEKAEEQPEDGEKSI